MDAEGKKPVYYGGGSELISMARVGNHSFGAVIDLKKIPEGRVTEDEKFHFILGLASPCLIEWNGFSLLSKTVGRIVQTIRCSAKSLWTEIYVLPIIYRETTLPLLLSDAKLTFAAADSFKEYNMDMAFRKHLLLPPGEFLVGVTLDKGF